MPSFARELEQTLHNALGEASKRRHEYATLEHLLIALIDDEHASKVMTACGVSRDDGNTKWLARSFRAGYCIRRIWGGCSMAERLPLRVRD